MCLGCKIFRIGIVCGSLNLVQAYSQNGSAAIANSSPYLPSTPKSEPASPLQEKQST